MALTVRPVPSTITSYSSSMVRSWYQRPLGSSSSFTTAAAAVAAALNQRWRLSVVSLSLRRVKESLSLFGPCHALPKSLFPPACFLEGLLAPETQHQHDSGYNDNLYESREIRGGAGRGGPAAGAAPAKDPCAGAARAPPRPAQRAPVPLPWETPQGPAVCLCCCQYLIGRAATVRTPPKARRNTGLYPNSLELDYQLTEDSPTFPVSSPA